MELDNPTPDEDLTPKLRSNEGVHVQRRPSLATQRLYDFFAEGSSSADFHIASGATFSYNRFEPIATSPRSSSPASSSYSSDSESDSVLAPRPRSASPADATSESPSKHAQPKIVAGANFTVEEFGESDYENFDSDQESVIHPHQYEDAESEKARSTRPSSPRHELDDSLLEAFRGLDCGAEEDSEEDETWEKKRWEARRKRRSSGSVRKRCLAQSIGSDTDDEDIQPVFFGANEAGSSARRLKRKIAGERTILIFDDPPVGRIEEEPENCEEPVVVGEVETELDESEVMDEWDNWDMEMPFYEEDIGFDFEANDENGDDGEEDVRPVSESGNVAVTSGRILGSERTTSNLTETLGDRVEELEERESCGERALVKEVSKHEGRKSRLPISNHSNDYEEDNGEDPDQNPKSTGGAERSTTSPACTPSSTIQQKRQRADDEERDENKQNHPRKPRRAVGSRNDPNSTKREHLYRCHQQAPHCKRCWRIFKTQAQLDSHLTVAAGDICEIQPGCLPDGITPEHEKRLRSRKKSSPNQSDQERWKDIYRLLFPNEEVPSPYFEPVQEEVPITPDLPVLASFQTFIRRELPPLVRSSVEDVARRDMLPLESSFIIRLPGIIQECQDRVFESYRTAQGTDNEIGLPPSEGRAVALSPSEPNPRDNQVTGLSFDSYPQHAEVLDTVFQPQPAQVPEVAFSPLERGASLDSFPGQSALNDTMLSDSGYASGEQLQACDCRGPCSCTSSLVFQSQALGTIDFSDLDIIRVGDRRLNDFSADQSWSQMGLMSPGTDWWTDS